MLTYLESQSELEQEEVEILTAIAQLFTQQGKPDRAGEVLGRAVFMLARPFQER
jgi:hypothetical protein